MTMVDTDLLISHLRGRSDAVMALRAIEEPKASSVSRFELYRGVVGRPDERKQVQAIDRFLERVQVLPLDERCCLFGARVFEELRASGADVGVADAVIAGTALAHRETLVSRNEKHYERVNGLRWRPW